VSKVATANKAEELLVTVEIEPENEATIPDGYNTRFYVFSGAENLILTSGINEDGYYDVYVDNKEAIVPVLGATFMLDPKNRDNAEEHPDRIYNAKANNLEVASEWKNFGFINDGWMTDENGRKVLRVMAGSELRIKRNIFAQYFGAADNDSALTFDIHYKVSNVTNTTDPIVQIKGGSGNKGVVLNALRGWVRSASYSDNDNCMFVWREGKEQYLSVNIHNSVKPLGNGCIYPSDKEAQANGTLALARVLLNGDPVREIPFDKSSTTEWCDDANAEIIIGNAGADIDIYSIRVYERRQIDWADLLMRNYPSSLPTTEEKQNFKWRNAIRDGRYISLEEAKNKGYNCIVYHGKRPYYYANAEQKGWIEYFRYDQDGNLMPDYSGSNCKETGDMTFEGQGSTAMTYGEFNQQDKNSNKIKAIQVAIGNLHESISVRIDGDTAYLKGGNLGKNYPYEETEVGYPYANGMVTVPDGWVDGNGKYRGLGYMVAPNTAIAQKKVAKINFASAMQSHLLAACKSYDELHFLAVGATPLQQTYIDKGLTRPVLAKHLEPFLMFWEEDGETHYTGLCTYGAAKMDKVAFGYTEKAHPMFSMFEGSDNNLPMTDFRVPFDGDAVPVLKKDEMDGYSYAGATSWDYDAGATSEDGKDASAAIKKQWSKYHNFIYLNSTNLKYYDGTADDFYLSDAAKNDTKSKYWCTTGAKAFHLLRYDFVNGEWVDAGMNKSVVNLKTDVRTKTTYEAYKTSTAYEKINNAFKEDMAKFFKDNGKFVMSQKSLLFNYCYVLMFLAGTDNSSKNTYYEIDPIAQDMSGEANDVFSQWYLANFGESFDYKHCYIVVMAGDDMDSILPVNNMGNLTKEYYIERLYPYSDDKPNVCLYEGMDNALFNLCEKAFSFDERAAMANTIFAAMEMLVSEDDKMYGEVASKKSVMGFLHKYFFNVQYYFPKIAYLEQARIRYEFFELLGHAGARGVRPISQSIGSQVENELQFMEQRVVYLASFAMYGSLGNGMGNIGISDADDNLQFRGTELPDGSPADFVFTIKPHQYLYPCAFNGQTTMPSKQRTSPNETCSFVVARGVTGTSDTNLGIRGINYISDLGDLSDKSITGNLIINGKRLTRLLANTSSKREFRPASLTIDATSLLDVRIYPYQSIQVLDFQKLIRCSYIYVSSSMVDECLLPQSSNLSVIGLYARNISVKNCPNITTLAPISPTQLNSFTIGENVGTNTGLNLQSVVESIYINQQSQANRRLTSIHVENVDWTDFDVNALSWLADVSTCELLGTISIKETDASRPAITWDLKNRINAKFGNVDYERASSHKGLLLSYNKKNFDVDRAKLKGNFYVESGDTFKFEVRPYSMYENTQAGIYYSITKQPISTKLNLNRNTGVLTVTSLSDTYDEVVITVTIHNYLSDGAYAAYTVEKTIELWNRPAQVGDLVYHDGTFSSARTYDGEKSVVGMCCYVAPRKANGEINEKFHNPSDVMTRLMMAVDDVKAASDTEEFSSWQWGVLPIYVSDEALTLQHSLYAVGANGKENLKIDGVEIGDVPNLQNISDMGLTLANGTSTRDITDESLRDESDLGLENDGFKPYAANTAVGDGFAYNEITTYLNGRKLTDVNGMKLFAGEHYRQMSGDVVVNSGYAKTLRVIAHRDNILKTGLSQVGIKPEQFAVPSGADELGSLAQLMTNLRNWAKSDAGLGDEYGNRWSQLYYPAVSACYAYEPKVEDGDVLATKFKKHHWFLATQGMYARLWWYTYVYSGGVLSDKEDSPFKDAFNIGVCKKLPNNMAMHSVTEGTATVVFHMNIAIGNLTSGTKHPNYAVRPICAF